MLPTLLLLAVQAETFRAPAGDLPVKIVPGGMTVLPNGRFLTPVGERRYTGENLAHVALSPNGEIAVGFHDGGFTAFAGLRSGPIVARTREFKHLAPCGRFTIDSRHLVVSLGEEGVVAVLDTGAWEVVKRIPLNEGSVKNSFVNDLVLTLDGRFAHGLDIVNQQIVSIDLRAGKVIARTKTGRGPQALAQSEDEAHLYVANAGSFDYTKISGLTRPPFGFPSPEASKTLGDPNDPSGQSIGMYAVAGGKPSLVRTARTGTPLGGNVTGGSSPLAFLVRGPRLFVAQAHNDTVQVLNAQTLKPAATWRLAAHKGLEGLRGVIPGAMALSGNGKRLYVCESGLNAVAVLDTENGQVIGRIPTALLPTAIKLDEVGGRLFIAARKGLGSGPRGRLNPRSDFDERRGLRETPGLVQVVKLPTDPELAVLNQSVVRNNGLAPVKEAAPAFPKEIKHVVLITKGGHTFDAIFGGLKGAEGQAAYAEFGAQGWIRERGREPRVAVMPNHVRLAERFAIGDNHYAESTAANEVERWLSGGYVTPRGARSGSPLPEEYPETGLLWDHLTRGKVSLRNYGGGYDFPGATMKASGTTPAFDFPMPQSLFANTAFEFPPPNPFIRDIDRVKRFEEDVRKTFREANKPLPAFLHLALRNDGQAEAKPEAGFPTLASYQADNDLALGRLVEFLSQQPEWKSMAIFVTGTGTGRDDDSIDRHRGYVLCISPYAKRGYVSKRHTNDASLPRTVAGLFGLPANNLFEALANPLTDLLTERPDFAPFTHISNPMAPSGSKSE
jgi:DNA-binding beta-propeller fold protein YncE